jgi:hypothetical protein
MTLKDLLYELVCLGFVPNLMSENREPPLVFHATRQGVGIHLYLNLQAPHKGSVITGDQKYTRLDFGTEEELCEWAVATLNQLSGEEPAPEPEFPPTPEPVIEPSSEA